MLEYRGPSTKGIPPVPPNFVANFISGGWRKIERMYGARDDRLLKWIELSGGLSLYAARRSYMRGLVPFDDAVRAVSPMAVAA